MQCYQCQRSNDDEAIFCVYCGVRLDSVPAAPARPHVQPTIGKTIDLGRGAARPAKPAEPAPRKAPERPVMPPPLPGPGLPQPAWAGHGHRSHQGQCAANGNWIGPLIGILVALFVFKQIGWLILIPLGLILMSGSGKRHRHQGQGQSRGGIWVLGLIAWAVTGWWPAMIIAWIIAAKM